MLVVEFALRYGNDFFLVPLQLPVGSVSKVGALIVTDTFGVRTLIRAAADLDGGARLFQHSIPGSPGTEPAMVVLPTAPDGPESPPIEEVVLASDEGANLCWAIEKTAVGPSGLPEDRSEQDLQQPAPTPAPPGSDALQYVMRSRVADNWYPLLPLPNGTELRLATVRPLDGDPPQPAPVSLALSQLAGAHVPIEEVTRDGHRIVRVWRYARGPDGAPYVWVGRRSGPAFETGASGLHFDLTQRAPG